MTRERTVTSIIRRLAIGATVIAVAACRNESRTADQAAGNASASASAAPVGSSSRSGTRYGVGRPATAAEIAAWDIDVNPTGAGLPPGKGTPAEGVRIFAAKCSACHGQKGEGTAAAPKLIGRDPRDGFPFGQDLKYVHTVGNYWPYATTLFDYINRAMPATAPGSLTSDEIYSVVAWILSQNEIIPADAVLDAKTLPQIRMPARDRFVVDDRNAGAEFR